jgi:hypothetical protein
MLYYEDKNTQPGPFIINMVKMALNMLEIM